MLMVCTDNFNFVRMTSKRGPVTPPPCTQ